MAAAVDDEEVPDVVRLLELIQDRRLPVRAHPGRAELVNRPALRQHRAIDVDDLEAGLLEHLLRRAAMSSHIFFSLSPNR